jgi:hypothetical protein
MEMQRTLRGLLRKFAFLFQEREPPEHYVKLHSSWNKKHNPPRPEESRLKGEAYFTTIAASLTEWVKFWIERGYPLQLRLGPTGPDYYDRLECRGDLMFDMRSFGTLQINEAGYLSFYTNHNVAVEIRGQKYESESLTFSTFPPAALFQWQISRTGVTFEEVMNVLIPYYHNRHRATVDPVFRGLTTGPNS